MPCKVTICFKFHIALGTLEWRFICMCRNVISQGLFASVFFLAKTAFERNFLGMTTHMNGKILELSMSFGTKIASPNLGIGLI